MTKRDQNALNDLMASKETAVPTAAKPAAAAAKKSTVGISAQISADHFRRLVVMRADTRKPTSALVEEALDLLLAAHGY